MTEPTPYQVMILLALGRKPVGAVYAGTASPYRVARDRARRKVARVSRRINRGDR